MFWGGMRGAVSIALVLSLPRAVEGRQGLVDLVFGSVLFSVVVQGLTICLLLSRLGLMRRSEKEREFEEELAKVAAAEAFSAALERMRREQMISKPVADRLQKRFEGWIERRSLHLFRLTAEDPSLAEAHVRLMQQEISHAQKQALLRMFRRGVISGEVYVEFVGHIDELLRSPHMVDWILAAELEEGLEALSSEGSVAKEGTQNHSHGPTAG
jgi:CPA1 family monovalent cation:H+ antiporter